MAGEDLGSDSESEEEEIEEEEGDEEEDDDDDNGDAMEGVVTGATGTQNDHDVGF